MINMSGTITNCDIKILVPKSLSLDGGVNLSKLEDLGFDCFFKIDNTDFNRCNFCIITSNKEFPEVYIISKDFRSIISPICDVKFTVSRCYSLFQWVGFLFLRLYRSCIYRLSK